MYPEVQRKAQAEIDQIIGNSRLPDFSDEGALPYVQAVLKEALRWHPVAPLSELSCVAVMISLDDSITFTAVSHRVTESDTYEGYYIPAGSTIIPNAWCVHHENPFIHPSQCFLGQ
jgi:cytochrome P450